MDLFQRHIILVMFFVDLFRAEALKSFLFVYYFFFSSLFELYIDKKSNQLLNPVFYMIIFTTRVPPGGPDGIPFSAWLHAGRSMVLPSTARTDLHAELQRNMSQTGGAYGCARPTEEAQVKYNDCRYLFKCSFIYLERCNTLIKSLSPKVRI